jgi:hypothetical protein
VAIPTGVLKFSGTIDGITVYHHKLYGWIVRRKGGPDPKQMKSDERFKRVRENGKEFGACAKAAGLIRRGLHAFLKESADARLNGRLTKVFVQIKNLDTSSTRGKRDIIEGLKSEEGKALLEGFDLNSVTQLGNILKAPYTIHKARNIISIGELVPKKHLKASKGATHVRFKSVLLGFDLKSGRSEVSASVAGELELDNKPHTIRLKVPGLNKLWDLQLLLLQLCFYQEINGKEYRLLDKRYNGMKIITVVRNTT